jgi:hypothetical protein
MNSSDIFRAPQCGGASAFAKAMADRSARAMGERQRIFDQPSRRRFRRRQGYGGQDGGRDGAASRINRIHLRQGFGGQVGSGLGTGMDGRTTGLVRGVNLRIVEAALRMDKASQGNLRMNFFMGQGWSRLRFCHALRGMQIRSVELGDRRRGRGRRRGRTGNRWGPFGRVNMKTKYNVRGFRTGNFTTKITKISKGTKVGEVGATTRTTRTIGAGRRGTMGATRLVKVKPSGN